MKTELKRILCATDLTAFSNPAVSSGIAVAKEFGAKIFLCHVVDLPTFSIHGAAYVYQVDHQNSMIQHANEKLAALMQGQSIEWEPVVTTGPVADTISRLVQEKEIDLAVSATHGRAGLKRLFLGSVTERLIRTIPCPLLVTMSPEETSEPDLIETLNFNSIMVGCDFSPDSNWAVQYGLSLAQEFQSRFHLVHVVETFAYQDIAMSDATADELQQDQHTRSNQKLSDLVPEDAYNWCEIKTVCLAGKPFEEITRYASINDIDLIVLGVRGLSMVETLFLGSTTDRVIRRAPCPVLSVCRSPV